MSSRHTIRRLLSIAVRILLLFIVGLGLLTPGTLASYFDPYGFLFVLVGGIALIMISFPGAEIRRAFRPASACLGSNAELRNSAHFWEAAGRGFWILGGLSSALSMMVGFVGMRTVETASISALIPTLIRALLSTFYGGLLAVICFVPCWRLLGIMQGRKSVQNPDPNEMQISIKHRGWRFGAVFGYVLFLSAMVMTSRTLYTFDIWPIFRPPFLVVMGGTLALMLFMGGKTRALLHPRLLPAWDSSVP